MTGVRMNKNKFVIFADIHGNQLYIELKGENVHIINVFVGERHNIRDSLIAVIPVMEYVRSAEKMKQLYMNRS